MSEALQSDFDIAFQEWSWAHFDGADFGTGVVVCRERKIDRIWLPDRSRRETSASVLTSGEEQGAKARGTPDCQEGGHAASYADILSRFFQEPMDISDLPCSSLGQSVFSVRVYEACRRVPPGGTITYRELASKAGHPKAARAVGNVMATNRIPLVIPCHRVIKSDGSLGDYGGGSEMKRWLLEREGSL